VQVKKCLPTFSSDFLTFSNNQMMLMCLAGKDGVCRIDTVKELCGKEGSVHLKKKKNRDNWEGNRWEKNGALRRGVL